MSRRQKNSTGQPAAPGNGYARLDWAIRPLIAQIGPSGCAVYLALLTYSNIETRTCWPTWDELGKVTGLAPATIQKGLMVLEKLGLVRVHRTSGHGSRYTLPYLSGTSKNEVGTSKNEVPALHKLKYSTSKIEVKEERITRTTEQDAAYRRRGCHPEGTVTSQ